MPWKTSASPDNRYIETEYAGMMTARDLRDAARATLELVSGSGITRLLGDCSRLTGGHSVFDLYQVAEMLQESARTRPLREAVLIPRGAEMEGAVRFWETAATNRGLVVRVFDVRETAIDWLCS